MKIAISAESTVDMTKELLKNYNVNTIPFSVTLGDQTGKDGDITVDNIIEYVDITGKLPKTSAVNRIDYEEYFKNLLKEYDGIIHFSLSSELSSSCDNAISVAKELKNVYVVDTRSLSTGIALLVLYACKLRDDGEDIKTIYNRCIERIPHVQASFVLKRLDYLAKGGRCSSILSFGANILKIRPQIILNDGKMVQGKKFRGEYNSVVKKYVADVLATFNTPDLSNVFLTYTTADAELVREIRTTLTDFGFKNVMVTRAGATITSHCGENCLGVLYINDAKN